MPEYIAEKELECLGCHRVIHEGEKYYVADDPMYRGPTLLCEECVVYVKNSFV